MTRDELDWVLRKYHLRPNKLRGQNFLLDEDILQEICQTAQVNKNDLVLEVGPGLGALTKYLVEQAGQVIAYEVEKNFQTPLAKLAAVAGSLDLRWQDILTVRPGELADILKQKEFTHYKIVANIPYYLTGKLISKFISMTPQPQSLTLLVQKEVAQRIVNERKSSLLSLSVSLYGQARLVTMVSKNNFYPQPQVDSAILHIGALHSWQYAPPEKQTWQLMRRGFASKRKKLLNNLASDPTLGKDRISRFLIEIKGNANVRAEDLSAADWIRLAEILVK